MFGYRNYIISNTSNYVSSPNYGPYDSQQYPSIVSNLNNGNLNGKHPTPSSFSIMDTGNDYSSSRQIYKRVFSPLNTPFARQMAVRPETCAGTCYLKSPANRYTNGMFSKGKRFNVNSKNYIPPVSCSENANIKKAANIGKSSLKEGLPNEAYYTNRSYDKSFVASTKKRIRSSGCVPPKKCSSIYNRQFTSSNAFTQSSFF